MSSISDVYPLAIAIAIPVVGGFVGGLATKSQIQTWYSTLNKPSWTPPNWLFGPVWTVLYVCMGLASWHVWKHGGFASQSIPLAWYLVNLVLNFAWTPLFFGMHRPDLALLDMTALLAVQGVMMLEFAQIIGWHLTGPLLGPYMVWTLYATALTFYIWRHNPSSRSFDAMPLLDNEL